MILTCKSLEIKGQAKRTPQNRGRGGASRGVIVDRRDVSDGSDGVGAGVTDAVDSVDNMKTPAADARGVVRGAFWV